MEEFKFIKVGHFYLDIDNNIYLIYKILSNTKAPKLMKNKDYKSISGIFNKVKIIIVIKMMFYSKKHIIKFF